MPGVGVSQSALISIIQTSWEKAQGSRGQAECRAGHQPALSKAVPVPHSSQPSGKPAGPGDTDGLGVDRTGFEF